MKQSDIKKPRQTRLLLVLTALVLTLVLAWSAGGIGKAPFSATTSSPAATVGAAAPEASASGSEWPLFRGNALGQGVATSPLSDDPEVKWSFQASGDIEGSAVISGGAVYFGTFDGNFYSVDLATGKPKWTFKTEGAIQSTPAISRGVVYFGDEYGMFHALDADQGTLLWKHETFAEILASATFWKELVLIGSYDNTLYALNRKDGSVAWKVETDGYVHGTPAIVDGMAMTSGCDGFLWLINVEDGTVVTKIDLRGQAASSPAVIGKTAYIGTFENQVVAIDLEKRAIRWVYEHPTRKFPYYASAAVAGDAIIIGGRDKILRSLNASSGAVNWEWNSGARLDSSAVVVGKRAYLGSKNGQILGVDTQTGDVAWSYETGSAIVASPAVADGKMVIGTLDGTLYCFG